LLLGFLGVAGLAASVLAVGLYLSSPATAVIGPPPDGLPDAQTIEITSSPGATIKGWWVAAAEPCASAVILIHGVRSNRLSMTKRAEKLRAEGFSVLLIDLQSHGESPGQRITYGPREALDAAAAVDFVRKDRSCARVGAIGTSLGGAAAIFASQPLAIDALVIESVYGTIDSALGNRLRAGLGPILGGIFTPILVPTFKLLLPPILGVTPDQLRPIDHVSKVKAPLLVISGTLDDRTPIEEARSLYDRASGPKQFLAVEGAAHVDLEAFAPDDYWRTVLPFLTEHLKHNPAQ
jgi:uncharacterized protein